MKYIQTILICVFSMLLMVGCGSVHTTTTTKYDVDGKVAEVVVTESDMSDFGTMFGTGENEILFANGDLSKARLGYSSLGLEWISGRVNVIKAPASPVGSNLVFTEISNALSATKTTLQTADVGVNTNTAQVNQEITE